MKEQIHGGDIYRNKNVIDFSVNSNPLGAPDKVLETIRERAGEIVHYPDIRCERLREGLSRFEQVEAGEILCGNGAAELLFTAVRAVRPKKALLAIPTFLEYERALRAADTEIFYYKLSERKGFELREDIVERITPDIDMMFLCNPNNPTGLLVERGLLEKIAEKCRECHVVLVLDETFLDFIRGAYDMKKMCIEYPNLLIIKAFTKLFCMPGLRLGYCISSNKKLLHKMTEAVQPWNVSILAQEAGAAALLDCEAYIDRTRELVEKERNYLMYELEKIGYRVYNSKACYIFFRGKTGLYEDALKNSFLIRDCSSYEGLGKGYYRIAVRTREENKRLIQWLKRL